MPSGDLRKTYLFEPTQVREGDVIAGLQTYPQERLNMAEFRILQELGVHSFCDALRRVPRPLTSETTTVGRGPLGRDHCVATTDVPMSGSLHWGERFDMAKPFGGMPVLAS